MSTTKSSSTSLTTWAAVLVGFTKALAAVACISTLGMIVVVWIDVIFRLPFINHPLVGAYDLVRILSAIALAAALPYTTAIKGHVAVEFFFHKLSHSSRIVVDSVMRLLSIGLFGFLSYGCVKYSLELYVTNQVSQTLALPLFWLPMFIALCCLTVAFVIVHHLVYPKRELIKP